MNDKASGNPAKKAAARKAPAKKAPGKPQDFTPLSSRPQQAFNENDFKIDTKVLLEVLGIEPAQVKDNSIKLSFPNGVAVLEYEVLRAVPTKALGIAMLRGANVQITDTSEQKGEVGEQSG